MFFVGMTPHRVFSPLRGEPFPNPGSGATVATRKLTFKRSSAKRTAEPKVPMETLPDLASAIGLTVHPDGGITIDCRPVWERLASEPEPEPER